MKIEKIDDDILEYFFGDDIRDFLRHLESEILPYQKVATFFLAQFPNCMREPLIAAARQARGDAFSAMPMRWNQFRYLSRYFVAMPR